MMTPAQLATLRGLLMDRTKDPAELADQLADIDVYFAEANDVEDPLDQLDDETRYTDFLVYLEIESENKDWDAQKKALKQ